MANKPFALCAATRRAPVVRWYGVAIGMAITLLPVTALAGGVDYSMTGGTDDHVAHQVGIGMGQADRWDLYLSLGSGRSGNRETDTNHSLRSQWQVVPAWAVALTTDQAQDEVLRTQGMTAETHVRIADLAHWDGDASLSLGWRRGFNGLRDSSLAVSGQVPDQQTWTLSWSQDLRAGWAWDAQTSFTQYSSDPVAMARALLLLRVPRTSAALGLTGFTERSHILGLQWQATPAVSVHASVQHTSTVFGQIQRALQSSFSVPVGTSGLATLTLGQQRNDAVSRPNGVEVVPMQTSNILGLAYAWQWQ